MTRKFAVSTVLALVLVMSLAVVAMAAGPGPNDGRGPGGGAGPAHEMAGQGQGYAHHGDFVDEDGDGLCDNVGQQIRPQDGAGNQYNSRMGNRGGMGGGEPGANFIDEDGDGLCDGCGGAAGPQGPKGRWNRDGAGMQRQSGNRYNR